MPLSPGPWRWEGAKLVDAHGENVIKYTVETRHDPTGNYEPWVAWFEVKKPAMEAIAAVPEMVELLSTGSTYACGRWREAEHVPECWECRRYLLVKRLTQQPDKEG